MDGGASGGRGGGGRGNGKGKKGKAARLKKAAAAAAAASSAPSGHEKDSNTHHGGKKLGATHGNVQLPSAQPTTSPAGPRTANAGVKDTSSSGAAQPQTQSKRKRKKTKSKTGGVAGAMLKQQTVKQPAAESEEKPAAKAKTVQPQVVQTVNVPLNRGITLDSPKAAAVKPHIVSLTGTKKRKKRAGKTNIGGTAAKDTSAGAAASPAAVGAPPVKKMQTAAKAQQEKKPSGVINLPVASGTPAKPAATTLKRKIAQVESPASQTLHEQPQAMLKSKGQEKATLAIASSTTTPARSSPKAIKRLKTTASAARTATMDATEMKGATAKPVASTRASPTARKVAVVATKPATAQPLPASVVTTKTSSPTGSLKRPFLTEQPAGSAGADLVQPPTKKSVIARGVSSAAQTTGVSSTASIPLPSANAVAVNATGSQSSPASAKTLQTSEPLKPQAPVVAMSTAQAVGKPVTSKATATIGSSIQAVKEVHLVLPAQPAMQQTEVPSQASIPRVSPGVQSLPAAVAPATTTVKPKVSRQLPALPETAVVAAPVALEPTTVTTATPAPSAPIAVRPTEVEDDQENAANSDRPLVELAASLIVESSNEDKQPKHEMPPPQQVSAASSVVEASKKQPKGIVKLEVVPAVTSKETKQSQPSHEVKPPVEEVDGVSVASPPAVSSDHNRVENLGIIMDSHAYVAKMMKSESEVDAESGRADGERPRAAPLKVALSPRPENTWGATFGTSGSAPLRAASSPSPVLSTTPLSSWFLSKGSANFMKHVHFSDDEEDDDLRRRVSHEGGSPSSPSRGRHLHPTSSKGMATSAKNAFLESLAAQCNWRSWYGDVDLRNLLDPPLAHIPDKLRAHEVNALTLPEIEMGSEDSASDKTKSELEVLETDIKREKQRGSAFSEQLLLMLQGKTVSGKLLEEEYRPLLQH